MKRGRPSVYGKKIVKKAEEYFIDGWKEFEQVPTVAGLALYIGITRDTVYDWIEDDTQKDFSYIVKCILALQERNLASGGLNKTFSPQIAALMLAKHGYRTTSDITSGGKPIPILGGLTNVPNNDSNKEDSETKEED
jgi:hypothetical protein